MPPQRKPPLLTPEAFEKALRTHDPALALRWGHTVQCWIVERKCFVPAALVATLRDGKRKAKRIISNPRLEAKNRYMLKKAIEESESADAGKRVVIYAKYLDNRVFDALRLTDLQNSTNLERAINASANREAKKKRDRYEAYEPLGREVVSVVNWAERKHSSEVDHGKAPRLIAEAFKREMPRGTRQHFDILDSHGRSRKPKQVKLELATR